MSQPSKQRIAADNHFLKIQTQSLSRNRILSDAESASQQRAENTARLRGLRLAKEALDRQAALAAPASKKSRRKSAPK